MSWHCCSRLGSFGFIAEEPHNTHCIRYTLGKVQALLAVFRRRRSCSLFKQNRMERNQDRSQPNKSGKGWRALEQDDFSANRHPALSFCLSMIFFGKPVPTFLDHARGPHPAIREIR